MKVFPLLLALLLGGCMVTAEPQKPQSQQCITWSSGAQSCAHPHVTAEQLAAYHRLDDAQAFAAAKAALLAEMKDPPSARITGLKRRAASGNEDKWVLAGTDYVCGSVNAKNSYGAYTGNRSFLYFPANGKLMIEFPTTDSHANRLLNGIYVSLCA